MTCTTGFGNFFQVTMGSLTTIVQVTDISGPTLAVGQTETTDLSLTARTYLPTIYDGGEITLTINYDPAATSHVGLTTLITSPAVRVCKLTFNNSAADTYDFSAFVTSFTPGGMSVEDSTLSAEVTLKITGAVTIS